MIQTVLSLTAVAAVALLTTKADAYVIPPKKPANLADESSAAGSFSAWKRDFRERALAQGLRPAIVDRALRSATEVRKVVRFDRSQPEFSSWIWDYLDRRVNERRISEGRKQKTRKAALMGKLESRFVVPGEIVLAIWGIETNYGTVFGDFEVVDSVATLAYDGRRQEFFEAELIAALKILEQGDIPLERMVGSWAGAMGHTQLIPTNLLKHAIDYDGDGRRDLWSRDAVDALASTANFLAKEGWRAGEPAMVEVRLPSGFDVSKANHLTERSADFWASMGVQAVSGRLPRSNYIYMMLPAGADGPAFAVYRNFAVIKTYNRSNSYAMAVSRLADRIAGAGPIAGTWPSNMGRMKRQTVFEIQERLNKLGYDTGGIDGWPGPATQVAAQRFQQSIGARPDGFVSPALLERLRRY